MPYGVDKKIGGDNKENDKWMENCVNSVHGKNSRTGKEYSKGEKIAICKSQMKKSKAKAGIELRETNPIELEPLQFIFSGLDSTVIDMEEQFMTDCMQKMMENGKAKSHDEALKMCQDTLDSNDNDIESSIDYLSKFLS